MLPNIVPTTNTVVTNTVSNPQTRLAEVEKALDAYKTAASTDSGMPRIIGENRKTASAPGVSGTTATTQSDTLSTDVTIRQDDQADIAFQMTREEREVFLGYTSGEEDTDEMSIEERITLQRVAERLEKLIEEADARSSKNQSRINIAMKEWYSRLASGKQAPEQLIDLIRLAAQGKMDDKL